MSVFQSLILGAIQGVTEFLPISSSGHLILVPHILGWEVQSLAFDAALHIGTLFAIIIVFYKEWLKILKDKRYISLILVGSLPAALLGLLLEKPIENYLRSPLTVSLTLISVAFLMLLAEKVGKKKRTEETLIIPDALIIGAAQAIALIPGVSRSGITITAGLFRDLKRDSAAVFSFLLGTPIILGAGFYKTLELLKNPIPMTQIQPFIIGIISSAFVGLITIKYLLKFLNKHSLHIFIYYRFILGLLVSLVI